MASVPHQTISPACSIEDGNSSEWEYEYHETEVESFYATLDLSALLNRSRKKQKTGRTTRTPFPATASVFNTTPHTSHDSENHERPEAGVEKENFSEAEERIQIVDFHSKNPIISYQNQAYTCQWTTTIGTDLLLIPPDSESPFPVVMREQDFDILATTGIKLVGHPVQLVHRPEVRADSVGESPIQTSDDYLGTRTDKEAQSDSHTHIPVRPEEGRAKHNQARFLERLMAAKAAKGEVDMVTVHTRKNPGTGWRSRLQNVDKALPCNGQDEARNGDSDQEHHTNTEASTPGSRAIEQVRGSGIGRPRGKRKRGVGGLFRDYRPTPGDTEGADIRGISNSMSRPWNELGQIAVPEQNEGDSEKGEPDESQDKTAMKDVEAEQKSS